MTPVTFWVAIVLWARLSEGARFRSPPIARISTPLEVFSYGTISIYHTPCSIYPKPIFQHGNVSRVARVVNPSLTRPNPLTTFDQFKCSCQLYREMKDSSFQGFQPSSCRMYAAWTVPSLSVKRFSARVRIRRLKGSYRPSADNVRMTLSSFRLFFSFFPSCASILVPLRGTARGLA